MNPEITASTMRRLVRANVNTCREVSKGPAMHCAPHGHTVHFKWHTEQGLRGRKGSWEGGQGERVPAPPFVPLSLAALRSILRQKFHTGQ